MHVPSKERKNDLQSTHTLSTGRDWWTGGEGFTTALRAGVKLKGMNSQVTRLSPSHDQSLPRLGFIQMRNDVISQITLLSFFPSFPNCTGCLPLPVSLYQFSRVPSLHARLHAHPAHTSCRFFQRCILSTQWWHVRILHWFWTTGCWDFSHKGYHSIVCHILIFYRSTAI